MPQLLSVIKAKLVSAEPESVLGLEVTDGPYKGVVFSFSKFTVLEGRGQDGMATTRFETSIHEAPEGFVPDESFDAFCADVLVEWLTYLSDDGSDMIVKELP
jgi:hypothetical protein